MTIEASSIFYDRLDDTPIDHLWIATSACGLVAVTFRRDEAFFRTYIHKLTKQEGIRNPEAVAPAATQIREYLHGQRHQFDLSICWSYMTPFQKKSLRVVFEIPYGQVRTYSDIAHELGNPKTIRAVGRANATNPVPLVVPCHRVIGADGTLRGFGGGLETKAQLLRMEGSWLL